MAKYIECEAVHDAVSKLKRLAWQSSSTSPNVEKCVAVELDAVHAAVENIPAADVRPVRFGKLEKYGASIRCSVCGFDTQSWDVNFCPNCGADMREES